MSRNAHCSCLCHGTNGNATDVYFSCKLCYAASHMGALPRQSHEQPKKAAAKKGSRKPKPEDVKVANALVNHAVDSLVKTVTKNIMNNIADAANELKKENAEPENIKSDSNFREFIRKQKEQELSAKQNS